MRPALALVCLALSACSVAPLPLPTPTVEPTVARSPVPTLTPLPPPSATPLPSDTPEPSPTSLPPSPTADTFTEPGGGALKFEFPFDSAGIWGTDNTDAFKIEASGGTLNIKMKQPDRWALTYAGLRATDFYAELSATADKCSQDDAYGLLFRLADANNFYFFGLGCGERYRVRLYQNGEWKELTDWTPATAVDTEAGAENRLAVRAVGDRYYFFVNEEYLGETSDASLAEGQFGLFAQSSVAEGLTVKFDNLQVYEAAP